jgi:hypothetical protein
MLCLVYNTTGEPLELVPSPGGAVPNGPGIIRQEAGRGECM